ncbi:MAG: response regulator, partial [Desulfovibrionaceae bacterium]|nr:response regulator [Desulfovibrionaceae bacterium]
MINSEAEILIVEDEQEISELLEENLGALGFRTHAVSDGQGLFAALAEKRYDLILLDIMLPGEDGLSLCRRLRAPGTPYQNTPIIFLSALGELTDRVVGLELGGDDYLPKPFNMRELVARIRALLRRSAAT